MPHATDAHPSQLTLGLAHKRDHDSSADAAARAVRSGLIAGHEALIVRALRESGCAMTLPQLAEATGLEYHACGRRMAGLVKRGAVRRIALEGERLRWLARRGPEARDGD